MTQNPLLKLQNALKVDYKNHNVVKLATALPMAKFHEKEDYKRKWKMKYLSDH